MTCTWAEISSAVPICNSLTFVFTAVTSRLLGETPKRPICARCYDVLVLTGRGCGWREVLDPGFLAVTGTDAGGFSVGWCSGTYTGMVLILLGVLICFDSKNGQS